MPDTLPQPATLDIVKRLVAFDTTSRDSNLALIDWVRGYLAKLGIDSHLVFDTTGKKANLWATIGPADRPGLVLSGHTDVVPIDGQEWTVAPFEPSVKDGKLYGRGTTDMKSFVGVCLALAPHFQQAKLKTPIHFAFSYDEEVGCLGVRRLLDDLEARGIKPMGCVVGEPTSMKVIRAHKGKISVRAHVRGFECHSSLAPRGVNAIQYAARAIAELVRMGDKLAAEGPFDREFDIPFTTVHVGTIRGGTALNIVPKDCQFDFEFRHLPVHDPRRLFAEFEAFVRRELEPQMRAVHADTGFSFEEISSFPGLGGDEDSEVVQAAKAASGGNATAKVAFGTEAGLFEARGIPTVICGPGDIDQAHKPDEFVALEQIALCEQFLRRLVERFEKPAMKPDTIVFDLGNVLIGWDPRNLYRKLFADEAAMEAFLAEVCTHEWNVQQDAGRPIRAAEAELIARFPDQADLIRAYYGRFMEMLSGPIAGTVTLLEALHAKGTPLYALTNWSAETFALARPNFPFLELFRDIVVSGELRLVKPDPAIFRHLLGVVGKPAHACFFIDDSAANIASARKLGFAAHHFAAPAALHRDLEDLGFL